MFCKFFCSFATATVYNADASCGDVFMAELTQAENTFHLDLVYGDGKIPANPLHGVPYFAKVYL